MGNIQLRIIADRLKKFSLPPSDYEGILEAAISRNTVQIYNRIGDMIEEVLESKTDELIEEYNLITKI